MAQRRPQPQSHRGASQRIRDALSERNFLIVLAIFFIILTIWVEALPYDPMNGDIADATTNAIWTEYYQEGKVAVTYEEWKADDRPNTQSVVVEHDGEVLVLNEKGPAHAAFTLVLGHATGTVFAAVGTIAIYMLGRRVFNWKVGAIAALLFLTNLTVVTMWYKDYWVDASTPHLLILSMWLFVESGIRMRIYLEKKERKTLMTSAIIGIMGGISFGAAIATRYTVAVVIIPAVIYVFVVFGKALMHSFKHRDLKMLGKNVAHMTVYFLPFFLGLLIVLVPLMNYNNTYFGGPFRSGYDAMMVDHYERSGGSKITPRNQTDYITSDPSAKVELVLHNSWVLFPVVFLRMMSLLFVPVAIWKLWKRPIFWLLFIWGLLIMIGFYSMDWVDKYANIPPNPWEPRYQLPALPPFTLLGAYGLYSIGNYISVNTDGKGKGLKGPIFAIAVTGLLVFLSLAPVGQYFMDVQAGRDMGKPGGGGGLPPGGQNQETTMTIAQIYQDGKEHVRKPIRIVHCVVASVQKGPDGQVLRFNMTDSSGPKMMLVLLKGYPTGTAPDIQVGKTVTVLGIFDWMDRNGNNIIDEGEPAMNINYGTPDKVIVES